jgi:hypothetical protein
LSCAVYSIAVGCRRRAPGSGEVVGRDIRTAPPSLDRLIMRRSTLFNRLILPVLCAIGIAGVIELAIQLATAQASGKKPLGLCTILIGTRFSIAESCT